MSPGYAYQPWPLDSGASSDPNFGPFSHDFEEPFWLTSSGFGVWTDTMDDMSVSIDQGGSHGVEPLLQSAPEFTDRIFVENTPKAVYLDHENLVGRPSQSDTTESEFKLPIWNTWAEFQRPATQSDVLNYAQALHTAKLPAETVQIDGGWEPHRGDLTFDPSRYPDPSKLGEQIHALGYKFGVWASFFINPDSAVYQEAVEKHYVLASATDPSGPCLIHWWAGNPPHQLGVMVDFANPAARSWFEGRLNRFMAANHVDGFKFDTRFFDSSCATYKGASRADYLKYGAEVAQKYDLQAVGIRLHWNSQKYGFAVREIDKPTSWSDLKVAFSQALAISTTGYPFVTTDMIGGSSGPLPSSLLLIRWAQASALTPIMYSSRNPALPASVRPGGANPYTAQTISLYRQAIALHEQLAPYIWTQVQTTLKTGLPLMQPLFFPFPGFQPGLTDASEWMLGDAVLAAPQLNNASSETVQLPPGKWCDTLSKKRSPALPGSPFP